MTSENSNLNELIFLGGSITLGWGINDNQTFTSNDILKLIFEILGIKENIIFKNINKDNIDHYYITPYRYNPSLSKKIISNESHDIGEGILELIDEIKNSEK